MTVMSGVEARFCRSAPWRGFARHVVLPWALRDVSFEGHGIEIGGGSGAMAYELLCQQPHLSLTMTDLDPAMVSAARKRLGPFGSQASVVLDDATALDFQADSFDFACSWLMLHHTMRWETVLSELVRVVQPGGTVIGYDLAATGLASVIHRVDRSAHRLIRPVELLDDLEREPVADCRITLGLGGHVMRFSAGVA